MRGLPARAVVAPAVLVVALAATGCGQAPGGSPGAVAESSAAVPDQTDHTDHRTPAPEVRSASEQAFLDDLTEFGLPTGMSADTTVEVGLGICDTIADGAGTDVILTHIRPLSSAIASQSAEHDSDRVGRAIVEASRTHLCD